MGNKTKNTLDLYLCKRKLQLQKYKTIFTPNTTIAPGEQFTVHGKFLLPFLSK